MGKRGLGIIAVWVVAWAAWAARTVPSTFYVDSEKGIDAAPGTDETAAWQSVERVNDAELIPGDSVLFKRGGLWRGSLVPQSGSNGMRIVYGAYGTGEKPVLQGSISRDRPDDWAEITPGVWATEAFRWQMTEKIVDLDSSHWSADFQEKAHGTLEHIEEAGHRFNRVSCKTSGTRNHNIHVNGPEIHAAAPCLVFRIRMRSTRPFKMDTVEIWHATPPWRYIMSGVVGSRQIGSDWQTFDVPLLALRKPDAGRLRIHFCLGGMIPDGAVFDFEPVGIWRAEVESYGDPIRYDVGCLIFSHGKGWGVKKWALKDVKAPLDYWYDAENKRVVVACDTNPAAKFKSVELALTRHIVSQGGKHDITYDGLAVRYGGAHGFSGGSTRRITIRNCDISWIGGGLLYVDPPGNPVRSGNAIEFWGNAEDLLVEHNRIWEVYDAALSNQSTGDASSQIDILYRHNVIWNAEYSFEFWNRPATAVTRNIVFEHNTCVDAGYGWAHAQRPGPNGAHLMFYLNSSATTGVAVRNNIFVNATEVCTRMDNDWRKGLAMHNNLYWSPGKTLFRWLGKTYYTATDFGRYQSELGMDMNSFVAEPQFVDSAARDYRLKPGSPGSKRAADGGPVGASQSFKSGTEKQ